MQTGSNKQNVWCFFNVTMKRSFSSDIVATFFPTWLIWMLAYLTFFIQLSNFNNRFMGSVTSLLVLASLLTTMQKNLPKTSYFKYVDCWFLWYQSNSILMIIFHVLIDRRQFVQITKIKNVKSNNIDNEKTNVPVDNRIKERMNRIAILLFPALHVSFNIVYIVLHIT